MSDGAHIDDEPTESGSRSDTELGEERAHGRIEILSQDVGGADRFFSLGLTNTLIGRDASVGITIEHASISGHHATIASARQRRRFLLRDERSTNGTKVNNGKLEPGVWRPLKHGDRITLGRVELMFHAVDELEARAPRIVRGGTVPIDRSPTPAPSTARETDRIAPPKAPPVERAITPIVEFAPASEPDPNADTDEEPRPRATPTTGRNSAVRTAGARRRSPLRVAPWVIVVAVLAAGAVAFFVLRGLGVG